MLMKGEKPVSLGGRMMQTQSLREIRRSKLAMIAARENPYPDRYPTNYTLADVGILEDGTRNVRVAGRICGVRKMGKLTFITISDVQGKTQIVIKKDEVGDEDYQYFHRCFDIGDFIGVQGEVFTTRSGEKTVRAREFTFLGKALLPLPEKFHGVQDVELCYRQRYLDLIMNEDTQKRFLLKSNFVKAIRRYLEDRGYIEIETPALINKPSGALARPFIAHHNALDMDVYLRIAPETYLKRAVVSGFTQVFEFARCFRNEGMDASHLQDFTMLECYGAYLNDKDNMRLVQDMLCAALMSVFGRTDIETGGQRIDFSGQWPVVTFRELILKDCGIDILSCRTSEELLQKVREKGIELACKSDPELLGMGSLIDLLYKKVSRPHILAPTFLTEHPISLSPLARANDRNPDIADRFQLVIHGAEVVNAYSELVDPIEQRNRLVQQALLNQQGDEEAMQMDDDYLTAMEYGMPPISGWGMGIDRIIQVITGQGNLRDSVLFPLMRPTE